MSNSETGFSSGLSSLGFFYRLKKKKKNFQDHISLESHIRDESHLVEVPLGIGHEMPVKILEQNRFDGSVVND